MYNPQMGYAVGAQNDIFEPAAALPASRLGCYTDSSSSRTLPIAVAVTDSTPEKCIAACESRGYGFAGVEYSTECYCGSSAPVATKKAADTDCLLPCAGSSQTCGGSNRVDVYTTSKLTTSTLVSHPS